MHSKPLAVTVALLSLLPIQAHATRYWANQLSQWNVFIDNGVVFIQSSEFAAHCSYQRGEIQVTTGPYERALYAFALSAKARGKAIRYVVDDATTTCVISGLQEV